MSHRPGREEEDRIAREAAAWIVRRDRGFRAGEEEQFNRWKRADSRHAAILAARDRVWRDFEALVTAGLVSAGGRSGLPWRHFLIWAAPVGVAAAVWLLLLPSSPPASTDSTRGAKEPFAVLAPEGSTARRFLPDGSVVDLGPAAVIDTPGEGEVRLVRLLRGGARFAVAPEPARPFVVQTENGVEIRALGTTFTVRLKPSEVHVHVSEGRVEVAARAIGPGALARSAQLGAGEGVRVRRTDRGSIRIEPTPPVSAVKDPLPDRYEFTRTPLARVAEELSRHGKLQYVIADPGVAEVPIHASVGASDGEAFVQLLEATGEIAVEREGRTVRLRRSR